LKRIKGWPLAYVIGSIPVLLFYSAGLSGWFFDYPIPLFISIFILFSIPLLLILIKHPKASKWNIVMMWFATIMLNIRIFYGLFAHRIHEGCWTLNGELLSALPIILGIVIFSFGWTIIWTRCFRK